MTNMVNMTNSEFGVRTVKAQRRNRFVVMLTDAELQAIEDHRFANRIDTTSAAVRQLVKIGLEKEMPVEENL